MNIPDSVINFLFNGITNRIELVLKHTEILDIKKECDKLREAIEWYNEHCRVDGQHLWDMYNMMLKWVLVIKAKHKRGSGHHEKNTNRKNSDSKNS